MREARIYENLDQKQLGILLVSILIVALCGIANELIIGTVSSYLLGNSVYQFSMTIGFFMFSMGVGSYISKMFMKNLIDNFIVIEIAIAVVGGLCSLTLFLAFPYARGMYSAIMYGLILVIGALAGLEIPILTRILSHKESIRNSIAHVLSLDYVGALVGSVMFPLLLLPHLGLIRSSFAIGMISACTAVVNVWFFHPHLKYPKAMTALAFSSVALLIVMTIMGTNLTGFAENRLYFDQVIFKKQTPYQKIVFTKSTIDNDHRLYLDGHIQFSARDEYRYHEALVHPVMSAPGPRKNILILGGGDGLAAREILKYPEVEKIHLVDIDPEITQFCEEFPIMAELNKNSLKNSKVEVFNEDAFTFINRPGLSYDRVVIDLPDPHNEALNKLYSREFYTMLKRRLTSRGAIVTQSSSPFFTRRSYWCIERTLRGAGYSTFSYNITIPAFGIWGFHLATAGAPAPEEFEFTVPTRFMSDEIMKTAGVFPKDMQRTANPPVNTIMEPKLYALYIKEVRN